LSSFSRSTIRCSFSVAFFSRSARLWARSAKDYRSTTRSSNNISTRHHQEKTRGRQLTVSALLMVTMLVRKACISSALLSTAPRGGVAVRASSAKSSPTTVGSGDLVREGEAVLPRSPCGSTTGLRVDGEIPST
jgi:hypothetical protein